MQITLKAEEKLKQRLKEDIESLRSPEGYLYAGIPKFMGLFGRDALISAWELLEYDPKIAKDTLIALSNIQGKRVDKNTGEEPGKIPHEYYPEYTSEAWYKENKKEVKWLKKGAPVYFSIDATLLFVIIFAKYFSVTGDYQTFQKLWPSVKAAIDWLVVYGIRDEFVKHEKLDPEKGLEFHSWKDGLGDPVNQLNGRIAVVEVQGYAYLAYRETARLAGVMGEKTLKNDLLGRAENLKKNFGEKFWMPDKKYFAFGFDDNRKMIKSIMSNPGHLLFTGIIDRDRADIVVKRLFAPEMWTRYGIRTHAVTEPDFDPYAYQLGAVWLHDNWVIAQGLKKMGYVQEYKKVIDAMLLAAEALCITPELYGVTTDQKIFTEDLLSSPCYPQAWSCAAVLSILS